MGTKIKDATPEQAERIFKNIFVIVGLKTTNIPNQLEGLFLFNHLVKYYSTHTLEEVQTAFELAVMGELPTLDIKDANSYQNFSVTYLSSVMNAYRDWASEKYMRLEHYIDPPKQTAPPEVEPHWGEAIEKEYQHFLLFGDEHSIIWPEYFYDQLVKDHFIEEKVYLSLMEKTRSKMIGELVGRREVLALRKFPMEGENIRKSTKSNFNTEENKIELTKSESNYRYDPSDERNFRIERARQITQTEITSLDQTIEEMKSGHRDTEIITRAKNYSVLKLFKAAKSRQLKNLYQKIENK